MAEEQYKTCPHREIGLNGDADNSFSCLLTGRPDADFKGWGYDKCSFSGQDYSKCSRAQSSPLCTITGDPDLSSPAGGTGIG